MFRGSLSNFEEYVSLLGLYANDFHFRDDANLRILKPDPSELFSPISFLEAFTPSSIPWPPCSVIGRGIGPPHLVEAFGWLVDADKILMVDNSQRRGISSWNISEECSLCKRRQEFFYSSIAVSLFLLIFIRGVWSHFLFCGVL